MTDDEIDTHLDAVLRASGSALKHYSMHSTRQAMRAAMRAAVAARQRSAEPVAFPSRRAVEREIERTENPSGLHLNDGKERVARPAGTLRYMLALIDRNALDAPGAKGDE